MLIIAILPSPVCPAVLRKYDLRKYVNTVKARSQTSVNKHNPTCGMCYCVMRYVLFLLQLILQTSVHLFKVRWNDPSVSHFSLMYRYGINTNILHLTFSSAEL